MTGLPWKSKVFLTSLSLMTVFVLKYCINGLGYTNSILSFGLWLLLTCCYVKLVHSEQWDEVCSMLNRCTGFAFFFVGAMVCGSKLDSVGEVEFKEWLLYVSICVLSVALAPFFSYLFLNIRKFDSKTEERKSDLKYFIILWVIFCLAYVPTLLASWPGYFTYDAEMEVGMVFREEYTAHHPILHVLLLGWIIKIVNHFWGSYNAGIILYLVIQIVVVSGCFAYMINFMRKIGVKKLICIIGTVFLALFPTISMFVCCTTKDVYFTAGIVLFTTLLLDMGRDADSFWKSKRKIVALVIASLMLLFFRNNGIYAYVLFVGPFIYIYRKYWKKVVFSVISVFLVYSIVVGGVKVIFDVKDGPIKEMFCVPMQQLARVHSEAEDTFSESEKEILYSLIPEVILDKYNPKLADEVKVNFLEDNFKSDPLKYFLLWAKIGIRRPDVYINSFLINTYGYWYPDTIIDGYKGKWNGDKTYEDSSYFSSITEVPGSRESKIPFLERFYEKISLEVYQQKIPVVSMLFSVGFWHWVYMFSTASLLFRNYRKQAFAFSYIGFIYLTVLLGPIALVRYMLALFFCAPLVLALIFDAKAFVISGTQELEM